MSSLPTQTDVLIVGARCAGSTLAMHLRRKNLRVVVVDACGMPSDQPMSTHFISGYGMSLLDELGVGDKVREFAPPIELFMNGVDDKIASIRFPLGRQGSCPRRLDLDPLLANEARAAGAEVHFRTKLVDLIRNGNRVIGAVVDGEHGRQEIRASVVVGADGRNSTVAKLVNAEEYNAYEFPRVAYWAYWPRPLDYAEDPLYQGGAAIVHRGEDYIVMFPTNRDQILMGVVFPRDRLPDWKGRFKEKLFERLRSDPLTGPLVKGEPLGDVVGLLKARFFFRESAGPGWALVGDAGLHKDPAPGLGITDALRDAKALAVAIARGTDEALVQYWRRRDVHACDLYYFAKDMGAPGYNNALNHVVFEHLMRDEKLKKRIIAVQNREISPFAAFSLGQIVWWVTKAMLRGDFAVARPFLDAGKRGKANAEELELRKRLADEADRAADSATRKVASKNEPRHPQTDLHP